MRERILKSTKQAARLQKYLVHICGIKHIWTRTAGMASTLQIDGRHGNDNRNKRNFARRHSIKIFEEQFRGSDFARKLVLRKL